MTPKDDIKSAEPKGSEEAPKRRAPRWRKFVYWGAGLSLFGMVAGAGVVLGAFIHYGRDLPDYKTLAEYEPAVTTRIHAGDGSLLTEFARQQRLFVPVEAVPDRVVEAFLAAEDKNFFEHGGLDYMGMVRAAINSALNIVQGRSNLQGASTITQQVARNFLLTLDQRLDRKIKEMILTLRIERAFTKDQILELYLNEIYLGNRSYGIGAAALNYFGKSLPELTVAEAAYLAVLPKAPNNYHPVHDHDRALGRRNWVLSRMHDLEFISDAEYEEAVATDLEPPVQGARAEFRADYFAEDVRRQVAALYGEKALYEGGLSVRTTLEPRLQEIAERRLRDGLVAYDRRHGWRGPVTHIGVAADWREKLLKVRQSVGKPGWRLALVQEVREDGAIIGLADGTFGFIPLDAMRWAREWREGERLGPKVESTGQVLKIGDVIVVSKGEGEASFAAYNTFSGDTLTKARNYNLDQIPAIGGALVALDPHTGRVLALVGGFDFNVSQFNRATQAERQPGSAFKPFVYAAALEHGFTPSSLILDAPFVMDQGDGQGTWKPRNSSNKFYGPSTLRLGLEKSRNLMTVRLAQNLGMPMVMDYAQRFGLADNMTPTLAASLGAGEVTLLKLSAAYGMLVNGGKKIEPTLIDRIQDRYGKTIFRHDTRACAGCEASVEPAAPLVEPELPDTRAQVVDPITAYQLVHMLEGVVERGTGVRIRAVGKPLAGKTGTTNDSTDTWFVGFAPDLVVGVFVGFDQPRSLGAGEEGSSVAVPVFRDFMIDALKGQPSIPFRMPTGVRLVKVDASTGQLAGAGNAQVILEAFRPGTEPKFGEVTVLDGSLPIGQTQGTIRKGTGGIY
ncbi:penicillin-binding protein 1A [Pseudokordiimonas caeni]|uniref:penicillin-binding protein 1A n=1 Tax=Pseudokordiimonas caeni TaxID=2997908 RepID=UPI002810DBBD|nr:penicillin-binding protein 1A [Pseudokordiimonas caeni]